MYVICYVPNLAAMNNKSELNNKHFLRKNVQLSLIRIISLILDNYPNSRLIEFLARFLELWVLENLLYKLILLATIWLIYNRIVTR